MFTYQGTVTYICSSFFFTDSPLTLPMTSFGKRRRHRRPSFKTHRRGISKELCTKTRRARRNRLTRRDGRSRAHSRNASRSKGGSDEHTGTGQLQCGQPEFTITVRNVGGETESIDGCNPSTKVTDIKARYEAQKGVKHNLQKLYTSSSEDDLNDNTTLENAGITAGDELLMTVDYEPFNPFEQLYEDHFKPALQRYEAYCAQKVTEYQNETVEGDEVPLTLSTLQDRSYDLRESTLYKLYWELSGELFQLLNDCVETYRMLARKWLTLLPSTGEETDAQTKMDRFEKDPLIKKISEQMDEDIKRLNANNSKHFQLSLNGIPSAVVLVFRD